MTSCFVLPSSNFARSVACTAVRPRGTHVSLCDGRTGSVGREHPVEPKCRRTAFQAPFNSRGPLYRITRTPTWRRRRLHRRQITRDSTEAGTERAWDMGRRRGQRATRPARVWALWLVSNGGGAGALIDCAPWLRGGLEGPLDRLAGPPNSQLARVLVPRAAHNGSTMRARFVPIRPIFLLRACVLGQSVADALRTLHAACCMLLKAVPRVL